MGRIYVDFTGLNSVAKCSKTVSSKTWVIQQKFQYTINRLDWDVLYKEDINKTAKKIAQDLEQYSKTLEKYQKFLNSTFDEYKKLDEYGKKKNFKLDYSLNSALKEFGSLGSWIGIVNAAKSVDRWDKNLGVIHKAGKLVSKVHKDAVNYLKVGRMKENKTVAKWFARKQLGLTKTGYLSTDSTGALTRFSKNLTNKTSPFNVKDALSDLTDNVKGKNGANARVFSIVGLLLSGVTNYYSNKKEQAESNGKMTQERVVAETITETAVDAVVGAVGYAVVGAAVAAVAPAIACPAVIMIATGVTFGAINAVTNYFFEKSSTELISDALVDVSESIGNCFKDGSKAIAGWSNMLAVA